MEPLSYEYSIYILYFRVVTQNRFFPRSWLDDGEKSVVRTGSKMARNVSTHVPFFFVRIAFKKGYLMMNQVDMFFHSIRKSRLTWVNSVFSVLTLVLLNPDMPCLCKQGRSRSVGIWRSQLIWIYTVCHLLCRFVSTTLIKKFDWLKIRSGCGILIYSELRSAYSICLTNTWSTVLNSHTSRVIIKEEYLVIILG